MPKSLPPLTWFRSFEAAARRLSSTAAAEEIGLTQSAVSQQIKALEQRLGAPLFHRHARGLSLTDDGRKLLPQVEAALSTLEAATLPYLQSTVPGVLTIAASISIIEWVIAPALPDLRTRRPDLSIRFASTIWPDEFSAPRADIEIRFGTEKQVGQGATRLEPDILIAVKHPDLGEDLDHAPLIEAVGSSDGWSAWSAALGRKPREPTYFVDAYGPALHLAAQRSGIALVSSTVSSHALRSGQVVRAAPKGVPASDGYYLSVQRNSEASEDVANWIRGLISN